MEGGPDFLGVNANDSPPRTRGRSFSQIATSIMLSPDERAVMGKDEPRRSFSEKGNPQDRALTETRKLLNHIMTELDNRPRPPSIWTSCSTGLDAQRAGMKRQEKLHSSRTFIPAGDSENEDEAKEKFSPQSTFSHLDRLRNLLLVSIEHSWLLFDSTQIERSDSERQTPFRFRRSSFNASGSRSRSSSPGASTTKKTSSGSLARCIHIINSIVVDDCRFQITSVRLDKPPNATHAIVLDIAQILVNMYRAEPKLLYEIGMALLPAFSTYPETMFDRLLAFFENGLLRAMINNLRSVQHGGIGAFEDDGPLRNDSQDVPVVAIQVDEVQDESFNSESFGWRQWLPDGASAKAVFSTNIPGQSLDVYYLSSIIGPLVSTILDNVDLSTQNPVLAYRLRSFFTLLSENKTDFPMSLMEIAAFHSSRARYAALSLLQSGWPGAVGHLSISKALPATVFRDPIVLAPRANRGDGQAHFHQFIPWHFYPSPASAVFKGSAHTDCQACTKQIDGFGLFCAFCMCAVHPNCYDTPYGTRMVQYPMVDEHRTQRVVVHRFSDVKRQGPENSLAAFRKRGHTLVLTNIFTLSLCGACLLPLWGHVEQGYRCDICNQYVHASCLHSDAFLQMLDCRVTHDSGRITINWNQFHASFMSHYRDILFSEEQILSCTHEELSVYWSILWTQLQLLKYGIASGTIILREEQSSRGRERYDIESFELHRLESLYSYYLESKRLARNPMIMEYCQNCGYDEHFWNLLNDWPMLLFIASSIKTPLRSTDEADGDFLNVAVAQRNAQISNELYDHPAITLNLAKVRDNLALYGFVQTSSACIMLKHLRHLGFFDSVELPNFAKPDNARDILCSFQLPLGLDLSSDVECLLVCIEACLDDLDVSINEAGLLLLARKLWPNGMASDYTESRLVKAIVQWVLSEDDNLIIILREYVARSRSLPGVPSASDSHGWPNLPVSRTASSGSVNNGNDYVTCRKCLLDKYVVRWLFALHCQDPGTYSTYLYDAISGLAVESSADDVAQQDIGTENKLFTLRADRILKSIMKVCQASIAFSVEDDLFLKWLAMIPNSMTLPSPLTNLPRLLNREVETPARWTSAFDATINSFEHADAPLLDPWKVVINIAAKSHEGLRKTLEWLGVFAYSGVDIPSSTFMRLSSLIRELHTPFHCDVLLCRAIFMSIWVKSLGRQDLQELILDLYERNLEYLTENVQHCESDSQLTYFIRATLSSLLLLYGCERARLRELELVRAEDVENLTSRRKLVKRASLMTDPLVEELDIVNLLILQFMEKGTDDVRCLILKFLTCLVTATSLLTPQELETLILKNTVALTQCIWRFYDMQRPEVNDLRSTLLLRTVVVDARAFDELLRDRLQDVGRIDSGLEAATKMFSVILDVAKRSFLMEEGKQWRSCLVGVFFSFFDCLWKNEQEPIRLATEAWSRSLHPIHHQSMALYFGEYLTTSPIEEKLELVSFLIRLQANFTNWKVLPWDVVIETLMDDDFMQRDNADESALQAHLSMYGIASGADRLETNGRDPNVFKLQASLVHLGLQMLANGVGIDVFSFLKLKLQLAMLLGFSDAILVPAKNGHSFHVQLAKSTGVYPGAYPCIQSMMMLVDSDKTMEIAASAMTPSITEDEASYTILVGSIIVDVVLGVFHCLFDRLKDFPYIQLKLLLQTLTVVIYKHDLECPALKHLREVLRGVVRKMSDLLLHDIGHECKHLALSVIQAYRKRWPAYAAHREMIVYQVANIIRLVSSASSEGDEVITSKALTVLEEMISANTGIFFNISKHPMADTQFSVLRMMLSRSARNSLSDASLSDHILKDTLLYIAQAQNEPDMKTILENTQKFIEQVHFQGYSTDTLAFVGENFLAILRTAGDFLGENFDPSPIILSAATLVQHNKAQIRGFLHYLETILRVALIRFDLKEQSIKRVLQVTHTLYKRTADSSASAQERNIILGAILEIVTDGFRGKGRISALTMKAVVDAFSLGTQTYLTPDMLIRLAGDAIFFMQTSSPVESVTQSGLPALKAASMILIRSAQKEPNLALRLLGDGGTDRARLAFSVRVWNVLILEALEGKALERPATWLFSLFNVFSIAYGYSLRANAHASGLPPEITASDVNQAFIAMKLWLILARKCAEEERDKGFDENGCGGSSDCILGSEPRNASLVWNELWPPFERLVGLSEADAEMGDFTPIATLVWSSVADILLFLRIMRSSAALDMSSHVSTLNQLQALGKGESFTSKFSRTMNSLTKPPPEVSLENLVAQASQELQAAEKIYILESRRELGRIPDRSRRDVRQPTAVVT